MARLRDNDVDATSEIARKRIHFSKELTPISQAGVCFKRILLGVAFEIKRVTAWSRTGNAASRVDVRINGATALNAPLAPGIGVGAVPTVGVLAGTAAIRGTAAQTIDLYLTTDAGSVMDDCEVVVDYVPRVFRGSP